MPPLQIHSSTLNHNRTQQYRHTHPADTPDSVPLNPPPQILSLPRLPSLCACCQGNPDKARIHGQLRAKFHNDCAARHNHNLPDNFPAHFEPSWTTDNPVLRYPYRHIHAQCPLRRLDIS